MFETIDWNACMTSTANEQSETRKRLVEAAAEVFVEKGYRAATIRDICQRAGTNIAAVNYHFRDKATLYRELLLEYPTRTFQERPRGAWMREGMSGEELLHGFVHDFLWRLLSPDRPAWHAILVVHEMTEPTDAFNAMVEQFIRPQVELLGKIVQQVAGQQMQPESVRRCIESIIPQVVFHVTCRQVILKLRPGRIYDAQEIDQLAWHITKFSVGGIRALVGEANR